MISFKLLANFLVGTKAQALNTVGTGGMGIYLIDKFFGLDGEAMCFTTQEAAFFLTIIYFILQFGLRQIRQEK